MIRTLTAPTLAALGLLTAACSPTGDRTSGAATGAVRYAPGERTPASYDWHVAVHGGSATLDFGDGDWVEGVSLFHLSCLAGSDEVEMSWGYPENAVLTSRTATGTFAADARAGLDNPVLTALRSSGSLAVGLSGADLTLTAKAAGQDALTTFFDYCDTGRAPPPVETAAQIEANLAEIAAQAGTEAPEAEAPAGEAADTPETQGAEGTPAT